MSTIIYAIAALSNIAMIAATLRKLSSSTGDESRKIAAAIMIGLSMLIMLVSSTPQDHSKIIASQLAFSTFITLKTLWR